MVSLVWRVRKEDAEGGGRAISLERLCRGIEDGVWSELDQARGPRDTRWLLIGEHPQLEEYLPPTPLFRSRSAEEAEMDMTPMIDVTFQLLIFFMIAATYMVQKTLSMPRPDSTQEGVSSALTMDELRETNIIVKLSTDRSVTVQDQPTTLAGITDALNAAVKQFKSAELVLDADDEVDHEAVVQVLDAAAAAQIEKVHFVSRAGGNSGGQHAAPPRVPASSNKSPP